jgi:DNA-binding NarL/FixJ family response regulator
MVRILIVYNTKLLGSIVAALLNEEDDIKVVECVTHHEEAIPLLKNCDIVIAQASLPDEGAIQLSKTVAKTSKRHVIVTDVKESPNAIMRYVEAGASGYVLQEMDAKALIENVQAISEGKTLMSPEMANALVERLARIARVCPDPQLVDKEIAILTPRERDVLDLVGAGLSNKEIAEELTIEVGTVKNHIHNILKKLDVDTRQEAARVYELNQLADEDE